MCIPKELPRPALRHLNCHPSTDLPLHLLSTAHGVLQLREEAKLALVVAGHQQLVVRSADAAHRHALGGQRLQQVGEDNPQPRPGGHLHGQQLLDALGQQLQVA